MKHTWLLLTIVPFAVYADMAEEQTEEKKLPSYESLAKQSLRQRAAELSALLQDEEKKEVAAGEEAAPVEKENSNEVAQETAEVQMTGHKRSPLRTQQKKEQRTSSSQLEKQEEPQLKPAHEALTPKRKETQQAAAAAEKPAE